MGKKNLFFDLSLNLTQTAGREVGTSFCFDHQKNFDEKI